MKKRIFSAMSSCLLIAFLVFLSCSKTGSNDGNNGGGVGNTNTISMKNSVFSPLSLTVTTGGTVTWRNDDNMVHTVTADNGSFDSGDIQPGGTYSRTFTTVGANPYHCIHHSGMTGTISVVTK